jgi:hypothetical protein
MGGWVGLRVGFININDMYNNDVGKGGAQAEEGVWRDVEVVGLGSRRRGRQGGLPVYGRIQKISP